MPDYALLDCKQLPDTDKSLTIKADVNMDLVMLNATAHGLSVYIAGIRDSLPAKPVMLIVAINKLQDAIDICEFLHRLVKHQLWGYLKLQIVLIDCQQIHQLFERVLKTLHSNEIIEFNQYRVFSYEKTDLDNDLLAKQLYKDCYASITEEACRTSEQPIKGVWSLSPDSKSVLDRLTNSNNLLWYEQMMVNTQIEKREREREREREKEQKKAAADLASLSVSMYS